MGIHVGCAGTSGRDSRDWSESWFGEADGGVQPGQEEVCDRRFVRSQDVKYVKSDLVSKFSFDDESNEQAHHHR